jgi:hypothetical protein
MNDMQAPKIDYQELTPGYEFAPVGFQLDSDEVMKYLNAVEDCNNIYQENMLVPPMAIAALAMAAMSSGMTLPPGAIHVSQNLEFVGAVHIGEKLASYARVNRKVERGRFHMLNIGIDVQNQQKQTVLAGETGFILPQAAE